MRKIQGQFVISLDFEMYWGIRDIYSLHQYTEQMSSERQLIPKLLAYLEDYDIHATWAIVGLLFFDNFEELANNLPRLVPDYTVADLSPYPYIKNGNVGFNELLDPHHYAPSLIKAIKETRNQWISTHTFSHYYCLEQGQSLEHFEADLKAAVRTAKEKGLELKSIIFPRNQVNDKYIKVLKKHGILSYRGNPAHWVYRKGYSRSDSIVKRIFRLVDSYVNLSGHNCYSLKELHKQIPINLPASHFLRPYSKKTKMLESLRLNRVLSSMTYAAQHGLVYHLWWHPYNFSNDEEANMAAFRKIIEHFKKLQHQYGMVSTSMEELCDTVLGNYHNQDTLTNKQKIREVR
ncbi:polysaccharide deacetylase family protein [Paenibacillus qinlingensis]|nr:polysaccharide deacetylase family protein [Paenibacillus qinlingensis]